MKRRLKDFVHSPRCKSLACILLIGLLAVGFSYLSAISSLGSATAAGGGSSGKSEKPYPLQRGIDSAGATKDGDDPATDNGTPSIPVRMVAPILTAPPPGLTSPVPAQQAAPLLDDAPANSADEPAVPTIEEAAPKPAMPDPRGVPSAAATNSVPQSVSSVTNAEPAVAIEADYTWADIVRMLEGRHGVLVAAGWRGQIPARYFIQHQAGAYDLREKPTGLELSNLGLVLHPREGDLPELQRRLRFQAGVDGVQFHFLPSGSFARRIVLAQQAALEQVRGQHKPEPGITIVLRGRLSCPVGTEPRYDVTQVGLGNGTSLAGRAKTERVPFAINGEGGTTAKPR